VKLYLSFGEERFTPFAQSFVGYLQFVEEALTRLVVGASFRPSIIDLLHKVWHLEPKVFKAEGLGFFGPPSLARRSGQWSNKDEESAWGRCFEKVTSQSSLQKKP
jgi:hypothetical protein